MGHRPKWRAPLGHGQAHPFQSAAFLARRNPLAVPRCEGIAKRTGQKCGAIAMRGSQFCRPHGGLLGAAKAEAERYGRPVIILRNPRKAALGKLGATEDWPEGLPKRPDLLALGPLARGRLFEAHANRHTAPDVWKHELRFRVRDKR